MTLLEVASKFVD